MIKEVALMSQTFLKEVGRNGSKLQCVIINKSDDKKTVTRRLEDSAVDY